ncbi:hypothetical protein KUCAC02_036160 [Chaenocephalus aceratus]|nr:hypothetical protein KUCAC02_036160 [Chaenocephalus aceratus]
MEMSQLYEAPRALMHPPPPSQNPYRDPDVIGGEIGDNETSIDLSVYIDPSAFNDDFLADLFHQQGAARGAIRRNPTLRTSRACVRPPPSNRSTARTPPPSTSTRRKPPLPPLPPPHHLQQHYLEYQISNCAQTTMHLQHPTPPPTPAPSPHLHHHHHHHQHPLHQRGAGLKSNSNSKKHMDKSSPEYRLRRERNKRGGEEESGQGEDQEHRDAVARDGAEHRQRASAQARGAPEPRAGHPAGGLQADTRGGGSPVTRGSIPPQTERVPEPPCVKGAEPPCVTPCLSPGGGGGPRPLRSQPIISLCKKKNVSVNRQDFTGTLLSLKLSVLVSCQQIE